MSFKTRSIAKFLMATSVLVTMSLIPNFVQAFSSAFDPPRTDETIKSENVLNSIIEQFKSAQRCTDENRAIQALNTFFNDNETTDDLKLFFYNSGVFEEMEKKNLCINDFINQLPLVRTCSEEEDLRSNIKTWWKTATNKQKEIFRKKSKESFKVMENKKLCDRQYSEQDSKSANSQEARK